MGDAGVDVELEGGFSLSFGNQLSVGLSGIPTSYTITIPKLSVGLDPITIKPLTINPLDVSVRLKEIPSIRTHVPANFSLGFSVLGYEFACLRLCGEAQIITEPFDPNPCEECAEHERTQRPIDHKPANHVEVPK
jgi:hypothetical protein